MKNSVKVFEQLYKIKFPNDFIDFTGSDAYGCSYICKSSTSQYSSGIINFLSFDTNIQFNAYAVNSLNTWHPKNNAIAIAILKRHSDMLYVTIQPTGTKDEGMLYLYSDEGDRIALNIGLTQFVDTLKCISVTKSHVDMLYDYIRLLNEISSINNGYDFNTTEFFTALSQALCCLSMYSVYLKTKK